MTDHSDDALQISVLSSMLLFFSGCAWMMPFVAIDEAATFEVLSLTGDTWYVGLGLFIWFAIGSYRVTLAESRTEDSKITTLAYLKKLLLVPFAPFLMAGR